MLKPPAKLKRDEFATEELLVKRFLRTLKRGESPWGTVDIATEWDYQAGRTDVLARTSDKVLIAFEAKLRDWKRAIQQAYRNTTYAQQAYVVMPHQHASKIASSIDFFERHNVGLCAIHQGNIEVLIESQPGDTLLPWITDRAHGHFDGGRHAKRNGKFRRDRARPLQAAGC